jgi:glycosyltransferase 2 family protein
MLDLVVLFPLLVVATFLTFQVTFFSIHDSTIRLALLVGFGLAVAAGSALAIVWRAGDAVLRVLPRRLHEVYTHFHHGAVHSMGSGVSVLVGQTVGVWLLEGMRFACILAALGLLAPARAGVGPAAALFLALGSSVLTTLPLTPAGLGVVEPFIVTVLVLLGVPGGGTTGAAVAVLERLVSYLSIAVFGFLLYVFSSKARLALDQNRGAPLLRRGSPAQR